ncbi:conserved hypothetical protein [Alkaliphilus metalliredigens QYMF]|uniref:Uncharacterized protein n=1 Tax=Alkaliphilus metalliredigens (strain QYMF) TaxID=293826 RepID=A6TPM6_ALKMQ|nr:DHHW family protein [Alkaliphilus metalliredigens]ABR48144.1 conserved hypothetical protein [Alkaliphilus metalliredigens QYMF]
MRINNKKNCIFIQNMVCMLPFLFILAMFILHLVLPDKTFSIEEGRYLAQWPDFNIENVLNGSYVTRVESYFLDQFPFRNFWVEIYEGFNKIL